MPVVTDDEAKVIERKRKLEDNRPWNGYRLFSGGHVYEDRDGKEHSVFPPAIVESQEDLAARWPEKFQRLTEAEVAFQRAAQAGAGAQPHRLPAQEVKLADDQQKKPMILGEDALKLMTVKELRQHAEAEEIDLGKAQTKEEILKVLLGK